MTVYISLNAMADQSRRPEPGRASSHWQTRSADPPLLTHVWRRLFEQRAQEGHHR
ncbi:multiple cyclophane-containing RiPP AmcA [Micromonospora sp. NPDC004551]|uniref:multiple cyclophane-containing RiPP AmcA n=1 Tax=Micromonospora sp. NPDC004551 TaxID=3154284 RepID=UPI0033AB1D49